MKYIHLVWMMTRYKSALVLVTFLLLSVCLHTTALQDVMSPRILLAAMAIILTYISATCVNDLADWKIDAINLQGHGDRPLVNGEYKRLEVGILAAMAAVVAIVSAVFVNYATCLIVIVALGLNFAYSLPPLKISHHPILTPFYLSLCYTAIPYLVGYEVVMSNQLNTYGLLACYLLFLARISLKDFRDRKGDKANGKATMVLKYGKKPVCLVSLGSVIVGVGLLFFIFYAQLLLCGVLGLFLACLCVLQYQLYTTSQLDKELLTIGYGARMGNGILFTVIGTLLLHLQAAEYTAFVGFYGVIVLVYGYAFWEYLAHSDDFYFGTRKLKV